MTFNWQQGLWLLILIPLAMGGYLWLQRRRKRLAAQYSSLGLFQDTRGQKLGLRRHIPSALFLIGLAVLILALARPKMNVTLPKVEGTVVLAFDVSGSMAADDLKPTRIEAAKAAAKGFIERQPPAVQIGVVSFSDSGFSVQSPTNDRDAILAAINRLKPQRGTSLGRGIEASLNIIRGAPAQSSSLYSSRTPVPTATPTPVPEGIHTPAVIILLTDGENNIQPDPLAAAQSAADRGVRIYTIGIGSAPGTTIKIEGFNILTQLNEPLLKQISEITDGSYYSASNEEDLRLVYEQLVPQLVVKTEKTEVTALFTAASLVVLLIGGVLTMFWFNRLP